VGETTSEWLNRWLSGSKAPRVPSSQREAIAYAWGQPWDNVSTVVFVSPARYTAMYRAEMWPRRRTRKNPSRTTWGHQRA
jgi:hypothetical protein